MTTKIETITPEVKSVAARSNLYLYLSRVFTFPDRKIIEEISNGTIQRGITLIVKELPYSINNNGFSQETYDVNDFDEFQSTYIRVFDVAPGGPPCPVYEGLYEHDRRKTMEDLMRFYEHFGLKPDIKKNELPDHISIELEFMHFLTFKETQALIQNKNRGALLRAENDFLERHLVPWIPKMIAKFDKAKPHEFYIKLYNFLNEFLKSDLEYVKRELLAFTSNA